MAVDISKIEEGDTVTLGGSFVVDEIDHTDPERPIAYRVAKGAPRCWLAPEAIVSHTPRELQVGDRARVVAGNREGREVTVKALDDGAAWVWVAGFGYETFAACNLERIP